MDLYLCIQGAIFLDKVIYRAFTEYIWPGNNLYLDENVMRIARIFNAVTKAIRNLYVYYDGLELCDTPVPSRLFPRSTFRPDGLCSFPASSYTHCSRLTLQVAKDQPIESNFQLTFTEKLCPEFEIPRLLFGAEMTEQGEATHL
jgi:hypothetical protein